MHTRFAIALFAIVPGAAVLAIAAPLETRETRIQATVEPAFRIAPLVHHYEAPRGKLLLFEFEVEALRKPTSLRVSPVGLRQEENGVIMPDPAAPQPSELRLETPEALELEAGERVTIRGRVRVPTTESNFHSFGVLVQDLGSPVERQRPERTPGTRSGLGVRFVTQYLLRCDIAVTSGRPAQISQLQVQPAELLERRGRPLVRAWVFNPTDNPVEFGARAMLVRPGHAVLPPPLPLMLPVRESLEGPERYVARILPGSRVRLEAVLPEAVFPGHYDLEIELLEGYRAVSKATFPTAVRSGQFPAQEIQIIQVAPGISAEPGQIELSLGRGGNRYRAITLANSSLDEIHVQLAPESEAGEPCEWFVVRPESLSVGPGQRRKVLVAAGADRDLAQHRYGFLRINTSSSAQAEPRRLALAVLGAAAAAPRVEVGKLQWGTGQSPAFTVPVTNQGRVHVPLAGTLVLTDDRGRRREFGAGYGRWLLPGRSEDLRFPIEAPLAAGTWELRAEISAGHTDPVHLREIIRVENPR